MSQRERERERVLVKQLYMHWHNIVVKTLSLKTSITTSGNEKQSMQ